MIRKKAVFLDRDGTINIDNGYTHKIKDLLFLGKINRPNISNFKNDGEIELARNLSRLVSGLYEAQFDHWRCRVYGPSEIRKEIAKVSETVLGI